MSVVPIQACLGDADIVSKEHECDLVERAKRDPAAFGELYSRYCRMLSDHVYRRTGDVHVSEDLVADVFLQVLRALPRYRHDGIPFRFWLLRIATNAVNHWARRRRRRFFMPLAEEPIADSTASSGGIDEERVQRALLSLPPKYQAVLSLYHLEDLSVKETSAVLGCREGTVRSRLTRARTALREKLSERR